MNPTSSTPDVLDLLVEQYDAVPAPAPSAELLARMHASPIGSVLKTDDDDDDRETAGAIVIPFAPRPRMRVRYLIAATVATFVAMSGLAVAGVLPHGMQRQIASVASEFGINLPTPDHGSTPGSNSSDRTPHGNTGPSGGAKDGAGGSGPSGTKSSGGAGSGTGTTTTTQPLSVAGTPLTLPATTIPTTVVPQLPPITAPPLLGPPSVPPVTVAPLTSPRSP